MYHKFKESLFIKLIFFLNILNCVQNLVKDNMSINQSNINLIKSQKSLMKNDFNSYKKVNNFNSIPNENNNFIKTSNKFNNYIENQNNLNLLKVAKNFVKPLNNSKKCYDICNQANKLNKNSKDLNNFINYKPNNIYLNEPKKFINYLDENKLIRSSNDHIFHSIKNPLFKKNIHFNDLMLNNNLRNSHFNIENTKKSDASKVFFKQSLIKFLKLLKVDKLIEPENKVKNVKKKKKHAKNNVKIKDDDDDKPIESNNYDFYSKVYEDNQFRDLKKNSNKLSSIIVSNDKNSNNKNIKYKPNYVYKNSIYLNNKISDKTTLEALKQSTIEEDVNLIKEILNGYASYSFLNQKKKNSNQKFNDKNKPKIKFNVSTRKYPLFGRPFYNAHSSDNFDQETTYDEEMFKKYYPYRHGVNPGIRDIVKRLYDFEKNYSNNGYQPFFKRLISKFIKNAILL